MCWRGGSAWKDIAQQSPAFAFSHSLDPSRIPALPGVPTMAEAGVPGHEATAWWAVVAPARTPEPVLAALVDAIRRAAETEEPKRKSGARTWPASA